MIQAMKGIGYRHRRCDHLEAEVPIIMDTYVEKHKLSWWSSKTIKTNPTGMILYPLLLMDLHMTFIDRH